MSCYIKRIKKIMFNIPECFGWVKRKALKDHICCECNGKISKGELYYYFHGIWLGVPSSYKVCVDCEYLRLDCDEGLEYGEGTAFTKLEETVIQLEDCAPDLYQRWLDILQKRKINEPL